MHPKKRIPDMKHREVTLEDKYALEEGETFITGVQALVRLPLEQVRRDRAAGINSAGLISGYRGSPLGGYDQQIRRAGKLMAAHNVLLREGLNEDLGATAVWGSQQVGLFEGALYDGVFGIWYGKAPGVDRTGDVFKHANFAGTSRFGGVLAVAGDDHNCKSSTLPSQSEFAFADAEIPVLNPASIQDVLDYGLMGLAMSRFSGAWAGLIALADTMDSGAVISVDRRRLVIRMPESGPDGAPDVHIRRGDDPMAKEWRLRRLKLPAAQEFVRLNGLDRPVLEAKTRKFGIVATGQAVRDIFEALDAIGITPAEAAGLGLSVFKVAMPWPLEPEAFRAFAAGHETLLVIEHKRSLIEAQAKAVLYGMPDAPRIIGKVDEQGAPLLSDIGSIPIAAIARVLFDRLPEGPHSERARAYFARLEKSGLHAAKQHADIYRKPHYCSGCPHNTSTVTPEGSRALAGIGCHYMATFMGRADMTSQMGGEGVAWIGQAPFTSEKHVFVNLGDGTYSHSGSLAIRAAVAGKARITYKILYNSAVAMTGGQEVEMQVAPWEIARQLRGEGVGTIYIVADDLARYRGIALPQGVQLRHRRDLDSVQRLLREVPDVSVLIYDQMCATEKRRKIKRGLMQAREQRAFINSEVCEGCGDCSRVSNCLSIEPLETELGRKRQINQSSCNQDLRCVDGFCPSFVSVGGSINAKTLKRRPDFDAQRLPLPEHVGLTRAFNIVFAGVGGTGVTTIAAIIGMAAHIDGRASSTLDMTGLAQKGGAVTSHVRIAEHAADIRSGRIPAASADVVVACDLVVATSADALLLCDSGRTIAFGNSDITPTAEFVFDRTRRFDSPDLQLRLRAATQEFEVIAAEALAEEYLYDQVYSNMIMLGYAWQKGVIPVTLRALYRAIKLNGVAVEDNMTAFDLGRIAGAEPGRLRELLPPRQEIAEPALDHLIEDRAERLRNWQDAGYAQRFRDVVATVRVAESRLPKANDALSRAVARYAYKLMAYKDEYEVARLYTNGKWREDLARTFAGKYSMKFHMAPPLFAPKDKGTGLPRKITIPGWLALPALHVLARLKFLRRSRFDPFGWTRERKAERALRDDYLRLMGEIAENLSPANAAIALKLASIPDSIRGYGHVKEASIAEIAGTRDRLLAAFRKTTGDEGRSGDQGRSVDPARIETVTL